MADGVQQVGLAQSGVAVDQQRVVRLAGRLGDRDGGGVREPVRRPDDEGLEDVLGIEPGFACVARRPSGSQQAGRRRLAAGSRCRRSAGACSRISDGQRCVVGDRRGSGRGRCLRPREGAVDGDGEPNGCPSISLSPSSRRGRSRLSSWLRVKSSGTATIAVFSCRVTGCEAVSQARWLAGSSSTSLVQARHRSATSVIVSSTHFLTRAAEPCNNHPHGCPQAVHTRSADVGVTSPRHAETCWGPKCVCRGEPAGENIGAAGR